MRGGFRRRGAGIGHFTAPQPAVDRLADLTVAQDNPGNLRGRYYLPAGLARGAPLVVVLHGCTQSAAIYDHGSGWSSLADRHGFALLYPEQQRANNMNLCFNWYQPEDAARDSGEARSIRAMIDQMVSTHDLDPARIFVTGLSAGGAMTSVMLAAYPEVFAAGAIIAGLPFGCADNLAEALGAMSAPGGARADILGGAIRGASPHRGPWPRVSVWHGSADRLVVPGNGEAIVRQWRDVHDLPAAPTMVEDVDGYPRRAWMDGAGRVLVEDYVVTGMAHGTPLRPGSKEGESGQAGAHMLDVGLSSTDRIAAFFGIAPEPAARQRRPNVQPPANAENTIPANDVQSVIERALRAAGLMR
ncbi:MAG TPA: PHB depolymerase family esterase [Allosphingosinicella sp.]|nr:PHB depolymerase family esterase [Allosphingosinicella sp.]